MLLQSPGIELLEFSASEINLQFFSHLICNRLKGFVPSVSAKLAQTGGLKMSVLGLIMNFNQCFLSLFWRIWKSSRTVSSRFSCTDFFFFLWWNLSRWWWIVKGSLSYTFHFSCHCHLWFWLQTGCLYLAKWMPIFEQTNVSMLDWGMVFFSSPPKFIGKLLTGHNV